MSRVARCEANASIYTNCGSSGDDFQVSSVVITPSPPVKGHSLTVNSTGSVTKEITNGTVTLKLTFDGFTVSTTNVPFCQEATCPVLVGSHSFSVTESIPSNSPSGSYAAKVSAVDQNNKEIFCVSIAFTL